MTEQVEKKQRKIKCLVVSDRMDKSRVGRIDRRVKHKVTGKYLKRSTKIMFHDENNESKAGEFVFVNQSRPMSKRKNFSFCSKA